MKDKSIASREIILYLHASTYRNSAVPFADHFRDALLGSSDADVEKQNEKTENS